MNKHGKSMLILLGFLVGLPAYPQGQNDGFVQQNNQSVAPYSYGGQPYQPNSYVNGYGNVANPAQQYAYTTNPSMPVAPSYWAPVNQGFSPQPAPAFQGYAAANQGQNFTPTRGLPYPPQTYGQQWTQPSAPGSYQMGPNGVPYGYAAQQVQPVAGQFGPPNAAVPTGASGFQPQPGYAPNPMAASVERKFVGMRTGGTEMDKRWPADHLPLKVFIQKGDGIPRYKPNFYQIAQRACEEWTTATNGAVQFKLVENSDESDIQIEWVEYCRDLGHDKADGLTQLYYDGLGNIKSAHVYLATTMPNRYLQGKQDNHTMRATTLHELGHALGLSHSPRSNDIMYFQNHSRQRIMVQGIIPINIPLPAGISENDRRRATMLYSQFR